MDAAYFGNVSAVRILLAAGADPEAIDEQGCGAQFFNCNGYHGADREARMREIDDMLMAPRGTGEKEEGTAAAGTL